jgi:hypothetical protein
MFDSASLRTTSSFVLKCMHAGDNFRPEWICWRICWCILVFTFWVRYVVISHSRVSQGQRSVPVCSSLGLRLSSSYMPHLKHRIGVLYWTRNSWPVSKGWSFEKFTYPPWFLKKHFSSCWFGRSLKICDVLLVFLNFWASVPLFIKLAHWCAVGEQITELPLRW